jgi:hypothetical protein
MVGGATGSPNGDPARCLEILVLNQTQAKHGVTDTGQDDSVLDKAFALIEGPGNSVSERTTLVG